MPGDERVAVGLVHGIHGLRGAVRVEVLSDDPDRFSVGSVLFTDADDRPLTVVWVQQSKLGILLRFEGRDSRESVEALMGRYLEAAPGEPLPAGTYYWHQIHGLEVRTTGEEILGVVSDVFRAGEGEVYVVRGGPLGEILVPSVQGVITELDPAGGRIIVDAVALALPDKPPRRRRRQEQPKKVRKAAAIALKAEIRANKATKAARKASARKTVAVPERATAGKTASAGTDEAKAAEPESDAGPAEA
jgi:16S rRNA processing protein RimM